MTIDHTQAKKWLTKELKNCQDHLLQMKAERFDEENRERMTSYSVGAARIGAATIGLDSLSAFYGASGCARVAAGDKGGWEEIDRAGLYKFWSVRLLACAYDADVRPTKGPRANLDGAATAYVHAIAIGADKQRLWLEERLRAIDEGNGSLGGKDMNPLVGLVAHLSTGKSVAALRAANWASLGPYEPVANGTFGAEGYEALADYHIQSTGGPGFPAFDLYPYLFVPFEILAIQLRTGIHVRGAKHPLLTSPFFENRRVGETHIPMELERVLERAKAEFSV